MEHLSVEEQSKHLSKAPSPRSPEGKVRLPLLPTQVSTRDLLSEIRLHFLIDPKSFSLGFFSFTGTVKTAP